MKNKALLCGLIGALGIPLLADNPLPPIEKVEITPHAGFKVNDQPFFPILGWLQSARTYPRLNALGFNVIMGNHNNLPPSPEMAENAKAAGLYAVPHFDGKARNNPYIFAWLDLDEPDITSREAMAKVEPGPGLRVNKKAPPANMVDGNLRSSSVLDPMADASVTIELDNPVTVSSFALSILANKPEQKVMTTPSEIVLVGDGTELLKMTITDKSEAQKFDLPAPATFKSLQLRVTAVEAGERVWGQIRELEGFNAEGENVLKSPPVGVVRRLPEVSQARYREMKENDPGRPVFLTLTSRYLERYEQWHKVPVAEMRAHYPGWAKAADSLGFDIYAIYGYSKPEWLLDNIDAVRELRKMAPGKPIYAWIECANYGSQQKRDLKVLPAHTRAEVWMSIIAGARAIGYFTHVFTPFNAFAPDDEMQAEMKRINNQITRLAPELLAQPADDHVSISFDQGVEGHCMATVTGRRVTVVAQNLSLGGKDGLGGKTARGRIEVKNLPPGMTVEVVDENRTITSSNGWFEDSFDGLQEHIYRVMIP